MTGPARHRRPGAPLDSDGDGGPLIDLRDVGRTVALPDGSRLPILTGVNLRVGAGEHVAVVGRSGSGKSTLLNVLGLLDSPSTGGYLLEGRPTDRLGARRRARLRGERFGFVFQQFNLLPGRTALENVAAPLLYARGAAFWRRGARARAVLDRVGLARRADSTPEKLSGGEQQRVAIARALVRSPRVLLADEPTGSLDVDTGLAVMDLLEELVHAEGSTLITITHDLSVARRADRQYRLERGILTPLAAANVAALTSERSPA